MRFYALILLSFLCPILAFAETCVNDYGGNNSCVENRTIADAAGDCTKLGYTDTATSCADGESFLKCPFDESKLKCVENAPTPRTCAELGFTETSCAAGVSSKACPIEETPQKYACGEIKGKTCTELGFTIFDKSEWCSDIRSCEENGVVYTLCAGNKTKKVNPPVVRYGDIKYVVVKE